jgi:hypothetical protein
MVICSVAVFFQLAKCSFLSCFGYFQAGFLQGFQGNCDSLEACVLGKSNFGNSYIEKEVALLLRNAYTA